MNIFHTCYSETAVLVGHACWLLAIARNYVSDSMFHVGHFVVFQHQAICL